MTSADTRLRTLIIQQAAEWYAANRGILGSDQRARFAAWLTTSPVHIEEYLAIAAVDRDLHRVCADSDETLEAYLARRKATDHGATSGLWPRIFASRAPRSRAGWRFAVAAVAGIGALGLSIPLWKHVMPPQQPTAELSGPLLRFQTRHGEQLTRRLPDSSVVHLNTDTAITVRYEDLDRQVTLTTGQADFEVVHEAKRAFRVFAGPAEVVAVGTDFDVRVDPGSALVTVVEGQVAVAVTSTLTGDTNRSRMDRHFIHVAAGQQIRVTSGTMPTAPSAVDAERETSWLRGQIAFDNEPLERVVAEFNRYLSTPIEIDTSSLRQLRVSGVFATDDSESFVRFLGGLPDVRVEITSKATRLSKK
jgi:transmembrane sensor